MTLTFFGREVATTLYASSLTGAARAFATWKLSEKSELPSANEVEAGTRVVGPSRPLFARKYFYIHQDSEGKSEEFREIVALINGGGSTSSKTGQSWDDVVKHLRTSTHERTF